MVAQQSTTPRPSLTGRGITASFSCTVVSERIVGSSLGMIGLVPGFWVLLAGWPIYQGGLLINALDNYHSSRQPPTEQP